MSNPRVVDSAAESSIDELKRYLSGPLRRELDALRAALDQRLAALEAALVNPQQQAALEELVLELARVATAEAEVAAAHAVGEAKLQAESRLAAAETESRRGVEAERAAIARLRREHDELKSTLETERTSAKALRVQVEELRTALDGERTSGAAIEQKRAQHEAAHAKISKAATALQRELAAVKTVAETATRERDTLAAELACARQAVVDAQSRDAAHVSSFGTERGKLEASLKDALVRVTAVEAERARLAGVLEEA